MLSYLRYNRISNGDYCKYMCLYSIECEIPELSNILDFTVAFTPPPFSPEIVPAVFHVCPFSGILFYRLYIPSQTEGFLATPTATQVGHYLYRRYIHCFPPQWKCNFPRKTAGINNHIEMLKSDKCHRYGS